MILMFVFVLFFVLVCTVAQKSKNQINREASIYPSVIFPRVFDPLTTDTLETPIQIRAYFYINLAAFNAWSNYHETAVDVFGRMKYKRPRSEHNINNNKNIAIMYSIWRLFQESSSSFGTPSKEEEFRKIIREQGFDPDDKSLNMSSPIGIGNREGSDTARLMNNDGWNSNGDANVKQNSYQLPFSDFTNYTPKNSPWSIKYPFKWQPVLETDKKGFFFRQEHVVPQAGSSIAFSLTPSEVLRRKAKYPFQNNLATTKTVSKQDLKRFRAMARQVFNVSENLTERQQLMAELFDNKVLAFRSDNGAGVFSFSTTIRFGTLPFIYDWSADDDILFGLGANIAAFDSMVQVWKEKRRIDAIRPTDQTMRLLFGNEKTFKVWGGPNRKSPIFIKASNWQPYIRTMPHSEFPSGSSCVCEASVEHSLIYTQGKDEIDFVVNIPKGSSKFYPGQVPSKDTKIRFNSLRQLNRLCGQSRLWAGVHFKPAVLAGQNLCKGIGRSAQDLVDDLMAGKPTTKFLQWLPEDIRKSFV